MIFAFRYGCLAVLRPESFKSLTHVCGKIIRFIKQVLDSCFCCRNMLLLSLIFGLRQMTFNNIADVPGLMKDIIIKGENHLIWKMSEQAVVSETYQDHQ